ncbi:MAG: hypothetical protein WD207_05940 [Xanthobacteraceae bacterium]
MNSLRPRMNRIVHAALAGVFWGVSAAMSASAQTGPAVDSGKAVASDSQEARSAKSKPKQPRPKMPKFPDVVIDPSPPAGPVPIPYPNTIK